MINKKISNEKSQWIEFVISGHQVTQVHSTGLTVSGRDDSATDIDLIRSLADAAMANELHSQQAGKGGVRWEE